MGKSELQNMTLAVANRTVRRNVCTSAALSTRMANVRTAILEILTSGCRTCGHVVWVAHDDVMNCHNILKVRKCLISLVKGNVSRIVDGTTYSKQW